jgi:HEAT repeat protein
MPSRNPSSFDNFSEAEPERNSFAEVRTDLLSAESASVRAAAARKLGTIGNPGGIAILIAALHDTSPEVRSAAVESLRLVGDATALGPLTDLQEREDNGSLTRPLILNAIRSITSRHYCPDAPKATSLSAAERSKGKASADSGLKVHSETQTRKKVDRESPQRSEVPSQTSPKKRQENRGPTGNQRAEHDERVTQVREAALHAEVEAARLAQLETVRSQLRTELQQNRKAETRLNNQIATLRAENAKQLPLLEKARLEVNALEEKKKVLGLEAAALRSEVEAFEASVAETAKARELFEQRRQLEIKTRREIIDADRSRLKAEIKRLSIEEQELNEELEALQRHKAEQLQRLEQAKLELQSHGEVVIAEVVDEPAPTMKPTVVDTESFSFEMASSASQEEEIILGHREFGAVKDTVTQSAMSEPSGGGLHSDKGLSLVTDERGMMLHDSSPVAQAALRLQSADPAERCGALMDLSRLGSPDSFNMIAERFDDSSAQVRNTAVRALCDLNTDRSASLTRALREAKPDRRRRIGAAFASSGLASQAINNLAGESREVTYDAFTTLFLMAKAGEVQPLIETIENHSNIAVRLAVIKLLAFSNQSEVLASFRRLAVRSSLPSEVRSAVMEAIHDMGASSRQTKVSAA